MNVDDAVKAGAFGFWSSAGHWLADADRALSAVGFLLLAACMAALFVVLGYSHLYAATRRGRYDLEHPRVAPRAQRAAAVLFGLLALAAGIGTIQTYRYSPDSDMAEAWKRERVAPLLAALPERRMPLEHAELQSSGSGFRPFFQTGEAPVSVSPMQLTYRDDQVGEQTLRIWAVVKADLPAGTEPFMTYKQLEWSLGHGVERGIYNPTVHMAKPGLSDPG